MDFVRRNSFWVGVAALVVLAALLYLVGVKRLAAMNQRQRGELVKVADQVRTKAAAKDLVGESEVEAAQQYQVQLKTQYQEALEAVRAQAVDLYKPLPNVPPSECTEYSTAEGTIIQMPSPSAFKLRYPEAVAELPTMLESAGIAVEPGAIALPLLSGAPPNDQTILQLQQQYWLIRDVVEVLKEKQVQLDRLGSLVETGGAGPGAGQFGGPSAFMGAMGPGFGPPAGVFEARARTGSMALAGTDDLGLTGAMSRLLAQRPFRLVAVLDFAELPRLIEALLSLPRMTLVRGIQIERTAPPGREAILKPSVRVDISVLTFDRYRGVVPAEVAQPPATSQPEEVTQSQAAPQPQEPTQPQEVAQPQAVSQP